MRDAVPYPPNASTATTATDARILIAWPFLDARSGLLARFQSGALDELDTGAVRTGDIKEIDRRTVRQRERRRLARQLHVLAFEHRLRLGDRADRAPADVIDRASDARH